ncbi:MULTISPECIES: BglG family transcription antiterminator [Virgibacillus]|uniref:Transcriptional regulator ManR n=2 Tax=Virgibacillus TaxID=84406 RepID=A0ABQ2DKI4_9BACI|nr:MULTISPECIES: BglG family transcription antiterminator [Virgibacillus]EQB37827.1 hypothetical protein M948_04490 [Virgibacillus sp. CM-4]GGJ57930.1 transcriptional regulator ManR [Virgibacillus kapii]CDQ38649.1 putative licABCH operon regulator [Virgibacillus massiliensis]
MNDRQRELLKTLLIQNGKILNIDDLSLQMGCSEKTVRNDLQVIEALLMDYNGTSLRRQRGVGITLEMDETDRPELLQRVLSSETKVHEDRCIEIAYYLLVSNKAVSLEELSNRYYVSRATVKKELEIIANWLNTYQLTLLSKPKLGNAVQGEEMQKRSALAHLSELISSVTSDESYVLNLFLPYEITMVKRVLHELQKRYEIAFTDGAMESLLVHTLIMVKRTRQKSPVSIPTVEKETIHSYNEYHYATWFLKKLGSVFRIKFPEDELIYFTWHLLGSKKKDDLGDDIFMKDDHLLQIIDDLINRLGNLTLFSFESDGILKKGLIVHIHSVINRMKYGFPITNPLLSDIKKMYPYLFNMVMIALDEIKENHKLDVPEDEAAYLVLHFQASLERLEGKREKEKRILIVCHLGVGMSHLLQAKIEHQYHGLQIVACIGKADMNDYVKKYEIDFIISTVKLEQVNIPYVMVSPLLEAKDKEKLNQFIAEIETKQSGKSEKSVLSSLIRADLIHLDVDKEHPFQVIEMLGNTLYKKGFINKEFIHSALLRERKSSTSIGGGIAIPHGNPTMINQSVVAVAVLKQSLNWGDEQVSLVFLLAISRNDQRLNKDAVRQIANYSEDLSFVHSLVHATSVKEFLQKMK